MSTKFYIGTAGWSYKDWEGVFYPQYKTRYFNKLQYLTHYFNCVELDNTFYRPPAPTISKNWVLKVQDIKDFLFTAKLWQKFTHDKNNINREDVALFKKGIKPLYESNRLGALLIQFPWSFPNTKVNFEKVKTLADIFSEYTLVIEFRHKLWDCSETLDMLKKLNLNFCNIDQPKARDSITKTSYLTGTTGYIRLHGRNKDAWFNRNAGRDKRYNYLYNKDELAFWIQAAKEISNNADKVFIIANNHYLAKAVVNALRIKSVLTKQPIEAPQELIKQYPILLDLIKSKS